MVYFYRGGNERKRYQGEVDPVQQPSTFAERKRKKAQRLICFSKRVHQQAEETENTTTKTETMQTDNSFQ